MTGVEWVSAPPPLPRRKVDVVAEQLRSNPGEWAVIARGDIAFMPWWGPLNTSAEFEVEWRRTNPERDRGLLFAPVNVYARYIGKPAEADQ